MPEEEYRESILEGLHHRIDNVKRDLQKEINENRTFQENLINEIIEIKLAMIVLSEQMDDYRRALNGFGNTIQNLAEKIEEKIPDPDIQRLE